MKCLWLVIALGLLAPAAPAVGQIPDGYFAVEPMPALPLDTTEVLTGPDSVGRYSIRIHRAAAPPELELVLAAERLFPSPGLIEADVAEFLSERGGGNWPQSFQEMRERVGPRWWWNDFDTVLIPWAVTGLTVHELAETVRGFAAEPPTFFSDGTEVEFSYDAVVAPGDEGTRIVTLTVGWEMSCGMLCGLWFQHQRIVTFDSDGRVVSIEGDGMPRYIVS